MNRATFSPNHAPYLAAPHIEEAGRPPKPQSSNNFVIIEDRTSRQREVGDLLSTIGQIQGDSDISQALSGRGSVTSLDVSAGRGDRSDSQVLGAEVLGGQALRAGRAIEGILVNHISGDARALASSASSAAQSGESLLSSGASQLAIDANAAAHNGASFVSNAAHSPPLSTIGNGITGAAHSAANFVSSSVNDLHLGGVQHVAVELVPVGGSDTLRFAQDIAERVVEDAPTILSSIFDCVKECFCPD